MRYTGINLMLPTYGRSETRLPEFIRSALGMADDPLRVYFSFMLHGGDLASEACINDLVLSDHCDILWENEEKPHLAKFWNRIYVETRFQDPALMVSMVGDDMIFKSKGWDTLLLKWCNAVDGIGGFFGDDCKNTHEALMVNHFTTRKIVDAILPKPFMCELFPCNDMDVVWDQIYTRLGRRFYLHKFKLHHNHATLLPENMDDTWRRLMGTLPEVNKNKHLTGNYVAECVNLILDKLGTELKDENIQVIMTTHDRLDILEATVVSYNKSVMLPAKIDVYDDCSERLFDVRKKVGQMRGAVLHESANRVHVDAKTTGVLQEKFEAGAEAVFVVDSDATFYKHWWTVLNHQYRQLKDTKDFGAIVLANLAHTGPGDEMCVKTSGTGAFGLLITREYWLNFVKIFEAEKYISWDRRSSKTAISRGKHVYVTSPSMMQHIGNLDGTHVGGGGVMGTTANDFAGEVTFFNDYAKNPTVETNNVLLSCMGRYGDIIHASFYANQLLDLGYSVTWLTLRFYSGLVRAVCPRVGIKIPLGEPLSEWNYTDTYEMSKNYPGYRFYVNAQPGSPEHHSNLIGSGVSMIDFVRMHIEDIVGAKLDQNILAHRELVAKPFGYQQRRGKPLCVIAPSTHSIQPLWSAEDIVSMRDRLFPDYDVRVLDKDFPNSSHIRKDYIARISFQEAITLLKEAALFIGQDSGLTWASLYSDCKKQIYHRASRIKETNVRYNRIDSKCEDIVIEGK